jgi:4-alpha-glucanotransferase
VEPTARLSERTSGILLHPTSLPGPWGTGDIGPAARLFVDWLAAAGQTWWQMLPAVPPGPTASPYDSPSSFAGSPWLLSLTDLADDGLLEESDLGSGVGGDPARARHPEAQAFRRERLRRAFARFRARNAEHDRRDLAELREREAAWLDGWTSFSALKHRYDGAPWTEWPEPIRRRDPDALARAAGELAEEIAFHEFVQLCFNRQWHRLGAHCRERGVALLGDVPMFVAHDSADVWCAPDQFHLGDDGRSTVVAGVPPDAFSESGQLWGNPLYRWDVMMERGFDWWLARLGVTLSRFDAVRLDHFIGFRRYWEIPIHATDARTGRFVHVPGESFFEAVAAHFGGLPFLAEDLGILTPEIHALRDRFDLPGMRVLQFAFGSEDSNDYRPHRYVRNCAVYTGTHDNDTTVGWLATVHPSERERVLRYLGSEGREAHWDLMRSALCSVANLAIFPLQDVLGLGADARMNVPGTVDENWVWRVTAAQLRHEPAERLRTMCRDYERSPRPRDGNAWAFTSDPRL